MNKKPKQKPTRKRVDSPFPKNLKQVQEEKGLSLRAIAAICKVKPNVVHGWLHGSQPQNLDSILRLCVATEVDFQWLLTGVRKEAKAGKLRLEDHFDIEPEQELSGLFIVDIRRLRPKSGNID